MSNAFELSPEVCAKHGHPFTFETSGERFCACGTRRAPHPRPCGRFWVSWYASEVLFTWNGPWWVSGARPLDDNLTLNDLPNRTTDKWQDMICAAVIADSEEHAKALIVAAHDKPVELEWRFATARDRSWSPFSERFPKADWMQWP